jgi:putative Holliday junction resolvase
LGKLELAEVQDSPQVKLRGVSILGEINPYDLPWPQAGRLAGIDFGTVRIGISLCDPSRTWTSPLETFERKATAIEAKHFQKLTKENQIGGWVVGLPLHCDGRDSAKAREVRQFVKWLITTTERPVRFIDERYTTALATRLLRDLQMTHKQRKKQLDKIAAHIILDAYLESSKHPGFTPITLENIDDAQISLEDALDD